MFTKFVWLPKLVYFGAFPGLAYMINDNNDLLTSRPRQTSRWAVGKFVSIKPG